MAEPNLAQRLGYPADAKLVVINADDLGSCHSANVGVFECLATGTVTSATLMVPCPWAREASEPLPGRGHRRAPHRQRGVRAVPLGPDHPRTVAARRRRRVPPDGRGRVGPRRPRRGPPRVPGPDRAGHPVGLRRQPPRRPHGHAAAAARVLRRLPGAGGRVRAAAAHGEPVHGALRRLPRPGGGGRGRGRVHRPHPLRSRRRLPPDLRDGPARRSGRASPSSSCTRRSTAPSCARWRPTTGRPGSTTTT